MAGLLDYQADHLSLEDNGMANSYTEGVIAEKLAASNEERQNKAQMYATQLDNLQKKIPTLEKGSQEYNDAVNEMQNTLHGVRELYHPEKSPGFIASHGHLITDALGITKPQDRIQKQRFKQAQGNAQDMKAAEGLIAAAPISPEQDASNKYNAQVNAQLAAINKSGMSEDNKERAREAIFKIYQKQNNKVYKAPDGTIYAADINDPDSFIPGSIPYSNPTVGSEELAEYNAAKAEGYKGTIMQFKADSVKSKAAQAEWTRAHYGGRDLDQLSPEEADQAIEKYKQESTPDTTSSSGNLVFDQNNQAHVYTKTTTSHKSFPGEKGSPATPPSPTAPSSAPSSGTASSTTPPPKTPAELKKAAEKLNSHISSPPKGTKSPIGPALDFTKANPALNKATGELGEAVALSSLADQVALKPNDAINQKRLAVSLEKMSAGRFTTQALDYVIKSGWGNTLEQWANNPSTGALPADVVRQLVDGAHQNMKSKQDEVNFLKNQNSGTGGQTPAGGGTKYKTTATNPQTKHKIGTNDDPKSPTAKWFDLQTGNPI